MLVCSERKGFLGYKVYGTKIEKVLRQPKQVVHLIGKLSSLPLGNHNLQLLAIPTKSTIDSIAYEHPYPRGLQQSSALILADTET